MLVKKKLLRLFLLIFFVSVLTFRTNNYFRVNSYNDPIQILVIVDDDYGANVFPIIQQFEDFGWNVTVAGLKKTLTSCLFIDYDTMETEVILTDISDVTVFDALSVLPGNSHVNLLANQTALDLIKAADEANLVISGWCKAVRVLAYADVLDGHNVTGHANFISDYEAAGATYVGDDVLPVIDDNIVTSVRSTYYRNQICNAIGKAIGVFESNVPILNDITVTFDSTNPKLITLAFDVSDESILLYVKIKAFEVNTTTGERLSPLYSSYYQVLNNHEPGICSCTFDMKIGSYEVDFEVSDIYYNVFSIQNCTFVEVLDEVTETEWNMFLAISLPMLCVIALIYKKRR